MTVQETQVLRRDTSDLYLPPVLDCALESGFPGEDEDLAIHVHLSAEGLAIACALVDQYTACSPCTHGLGDERRLEAGGRSWKPGLTQAETIVRVID